MSICWGADPKPQPPVLLPNQGAPGTPGAAAAAVVHEPEASARRGVPVLLLTLLALGSNPAAATSGMERLHREWWPDGTPRVEAHYLGDVYHGEYRAWYRTGQLYEVRHYDRGREEGLQQSWTPDGELYLNYEVRNGRRYGYVNARPCTGVPIEGSRLTTAD